MKLKRHEFIILLAVAIIFAVTLFSMLTSPSRGSQLDKEGVYFVSEEEELAFVPLREASIVRMGYIKPVEYYVLQRLSKISKLREVGRWFGLIGAPITFVGKIMPAIEGVTFGAKGIVFFVGFGISTTGAVLQFVGKDKKPTVEPVFLYIFEGEETRINPRGNRTLLVLGDESSLLAAGFLFKHGEKIAGVDEEYVTVMETDGEVIIEGGTNGNMVVISDGQRYENRFILIE